jgi:putative transposase
MRRGETSATWAQDEGSGPSSARDRDRPPGREGAWRDNIFVERLWRSIKYDEVYLRGYDSVSEACASIGQYLTFYNGRRPHSSLDSKTPDQAYFTPLPLRLAA